MGKLEDRIIQGLMKVEEGIDAAGLTDTQAWKDTAIELEEITQDIPKAMSGLTELLSLSLEGLQSISENSASNTLSLAEVISKAMTASIQYLQDNPIGEPLLSEATQALTTALAKEPGERDLNAGPKPVLSDALQDYMPEVDDFELIAEFITEGSDLIASAEEALLMLESNPGDMGAVDTVFRAFHTIKGSAAFLDLSLVADMGHHAESLLSRVREGEIRYTGEYADLALRALDMLKDLIQGVEKAFGGEPLNKPQGYDDLMRTLEHPEGSCNSEESLEMVSPRIGDILVAQGKIKREEIEKIAASQGEKPIGVKILESKAASVTDVGQALRIKKQMNGASKNQVQSSVRVTTDRLDRLVDMVGELVIAHSIVMQDHIVVTADCNEFSKKVSHANKIVRELQKMTMSLRMVPLKATFRKMNRLVRDMSRKVGKDVNFVIEGEDTEIDRNMADAIKDPLIHMVRNAVDHGLESPRVREEAGKPKDGLVKLSAYHSAGKVVVEIKDDGKGLDRQAILAKAGEKRLVSDGASLSDREVFNLIFEPGFSTAKAVTDISGRGVGMDVVKKNIETLRGQTEIQSQLGKGSVFQMKLPLTLAIIDGMVVRVGPENYIIPTPSIVTSIKPDPKNVSSVHQQGEMISLQERLIPLFRLETLFRTKGVEQKQNLDLVVVVEDDGRQVGLVINELIGRQQVVIKTLGEAMQGIQGISGGAIMPNGRVGLILDVGGLIRLANVGEEARSAA